MKIISSLLILSFFAISCSSSKYTKTVPHVDLNRFMKKWYFIAGRFTFMEDGAHNATEKYKLSKDGKQIDIDFRFKKDSFDGPLKKIPQKAWVENHKTNAHWKVRPFWPLKFDYLIIELAEDYSWTAIGVPNEKYLWIMAETYEIDDKKLKEILQTVEETGYPVDDITRIPHQY